MITTRRNIVKVYAIPIILMLFIIGLGAFVLTEKTEFYSTDSGELNERFYTSIIAFVVMVGIAVYESIKVIKIVPAVILDMDNNKITVGKQAYAISDIEEVILSGKFEYPFHSLRKMKELMFREGLEIKFKDTKAIHLFEEFYYNLNELKLALERTQGTSAKVEKTITSYNNLAFRNNQFLKPRGVLTWTAMTLLILKYFVIEQHEMNDYRTVSVLLLCVIVFFYQSLLMHYFVFNKKQFFVKNENLFWKNQLFELSEIKEVVYENDSGILAIFKRKYLRIILSNHKQYKIGADLLRKKDWFQMKGEFEKINIPVRVEF